MVPHKLEKAEEDLTEHQQQYDSMMQLRPIKESVSDSFFLALVVCSPGLRDLSELEQQRVGEARSWCCTVTCH